MNDTFILFDTSADSFVVNVPDSDSFAMWQGLVGPYFTPSLDAAGNLSWTNNGGLINPATVNIQGRSLNVAGIVATAGSLPASAGENDVYLVGVSAPYEGYLYTSGTWVDIGVIGPGRDGQDGAPGASAGFGSPTATVDPATGPVGVSVTASGPDTAKVFAFTFYGLNGKVDKAGDTMTGSLTAPSFLTGTDATHYFQTRKMRGEGDADSYYHAVDFGYSGNNKVDFYEYGGEWNFYRSDETPAVLVGQIHKTFGWRGKVAGHNVSDFVTKKASVSLTTSSPAWAETSPGSGIYVEDVTVSTGTEHTKVDLQPTAAQILQLISDGVQALFIENNSSMFTAYAIGAAPTTAMTIQATLTEVEE